MCLYAIPSLTKTVRIVGGCSIFTVLNKSLPAREVIKKKSEMNLYIVKRKGSAGYDTYSSFLICCESEQEARETSPNGDRLVEGAKTWLYESKHWSWVRVSEIHLLDVEHIGTANNNIERGVLMAEFHAG